MAREVEKGTADNSSHKKRCNSLIIMKLRGNEEDTLEIIPSDSESNYIAVVQYRWK
jgi:hypothetical protein